MMEWMSDKRGRWLTEFSLIDNRIRSYSLTQLQMDLIKITRFIYRIRKNTITSILSRQKLFTTCSDYIYDFFDKL